MASTITTNGQTVGPKVKRRQVDLNFGAILDWRAERVSMQMVKLGQPEKNGLVEALRHLDRVPMVPNHRSIEKCADNDYMNPSNFTP